MPGRDKPLITRNGIPDPQAYNPQTGQWESFIGVSWGKTAGGLYVPIRVDDQGRQEVTLSGTIVGEVTLVDATTATHTAAVYYPIPIDFLRSFSEVEFHIINSFDVALAIGLRIASGTSTVQPSILLENGEIAPYFPTLDGCVHIVPSGVNNLPLSEIHPETQSGVKSKHPVPFRLFIPTMTADVRLGVRAYPYGQSSSEGALTIIAKGWL